MSTIPKDNDKPFNTKTVLETLIWAAEYLLHNKSYDGGNYEEIEICVTRAKELLPQLATDGREELEKEFLKQKMGIEGFAKEQIAAKDDQITNLQSSKEELEKGLEDLINQYEMVVTEKFNALSIPVNFEELPTLVKAKKLLNK